MLRVELAKTLPFREYLLLIPNTTQKKNLGLINIDYYLYFKNKYGRCIFMKEVI